MEDQQWLKALVDRSIREATTSFEKELVEIRSMLFEVVSKKNHELPMAIAQLITL